MSQLIALCGAPGSGKTAVQDILWQRYSAMQIDDGWPLRDFAMRHCGAKLLDVETQAGKAKAFLFPGGKTMTMREFLGKFGNAIEALLGPDSIPEMAIEQTRWPTNKQFTRFSFGSVRRQQGRVYKREGGVVVEVVREGCAIKNEFDRYDRSCVDITIQNDGDLAALEATVKAQLGPLFV